MNVEEYWRMLRDEIAIATTPEHAEKVLPEGTMKTAVEWTERSSEAVLPVPHADGHARDDGLD